MFVDAHIIILYASEGYMTEGLRSPSNRIAFGVRSDSVRGPIRLRTVSESVADAVEKICCGFRAQKKGMTDAIPYYDWIKTLL